MSLFLSERKVIERGMHKNPVWLLENGIPYHMTKNEALEVISACSVATLQDAAYNYQEREDLVSIINIISEKLRLGGYFTDEEMQEMYREEMTG